MTENSRVKWRSKRIDSPLGSDDTHSFGYDMVEESDIEVGVENDDLAEDQDGYGSRREGRLFVDAAEYNEEDTRPNQEQEEDRSEVSSTGTDGGEALPNLDELVKLTDSHCRVGCRITSLNRVKVMSVCGGSANPKSRNYCNRHAEKRNKTHLIHRAG